MHFNIYYSLCNWLFRMYNVRTGHQITVPLPVDIFNESPSFTVTHLDFAVPVYIKNSDEKYNILIGNYAAARALNLELVNKLTTEVF